MLKKKLKRLQQQARNKYREFSNEKKSIKKEYDENRDRDMLEYAKKYCIVKSILL